MCYLKVSAGYWKVGAMYYSKGAIEGIIYWISLKELPYLVETIQSLVIFL